MPDVDRHVSQWQRHVSIGKASAARVTSCLVCPQRHVIVAFIVFQLELVDIIEGIDGKTRCYPNPRIYSKSTRRFRLAWHRFVTTSIDLTRVRIDHEIQRLRRDPSTCKRRPEIPSGRFDHGALSQSNLCPMTPRPCRSQSVKRKQPPEEDNVN
jgi:hypothetical protein